ncbi:MAG TPA: bifunctional hydroxymethylpyrimidine kinase/phosphomethylpyrimidine kinase [Candidatus Micrarchaeia archaeon]|nr:bifunctional hydroxymethylpyrimidine kinase/phosphomethylpyrimidine kinase [Candidatus Micrarchaeia archaeon]
MTCAMPIAATIATSDSGGGAGIQADLKTFAAHGVFGVSVLVACTAQNTVGVRAIEPLPVAFVRAQMEALAADLRPRAVKTGMLFTEAHVLEVAAGLSRHDFGQLVVDPVMVAKSGDRLLRTTAIAALREILLPLALVVTPNWPEAAVLSHLPVGDEAEGEAAGRRILDLGPRFVVVKGGHAPGPPTDLVVHAGGVERLGGERIPSPHTHGTGCTFSAAITAQLARGVEPLRAITIAKRYVSQAIAAAPGLGAGHGPLQHFPKGWDADDGATIDGEPAR